MDTVTALRRLELAQLKIAVLKAQLAGATALAVSLQKTVDVLTAALAAQSASTLHALPAQPVWPPGQGSTGGVPNMAQWEAQMAEEDTPSSVEEGEEVPPLTLGGLSERIHTLWGGGDEPQKGDFVEGTAWPKSKPVTEETPTDESHPGEPAQ